MNQQNVRTIELTEYDPRSLAPDTGTDEIGQLLWTEYRDKIDVSFPTPKTKGLWEFKSLGWVGHIALQNRARLVLHSKVPLANLFGMLEYAYRLKSFHILGGIVECASLQEFYESLAQVLARRTLDRGRKGFYRTYITEMSPLLCLRGRVELQDTLRRPWDTKLVCQYEEHTVDVAENQILAWTLQTILRNSMCTEKVRPTVRRAYRSLQGLVSAFPFAAGDCTGRTYNRLNSDYETLHALCRFFLEHSGPSHEIGHKSTLPFLVNMAQLFETFVAEWLRSHLPGNTTLASQQRLPLGHRHSLHFQIDLVLYDRDAGVPVCVLDTKYKHSLSPDTKDVAQVVAYAEAVGCTNAFLVYPAPLTEDFDATIGNIRVRNVSFPLDKDIETAGQEFLQAVLPPPLNEDTRIIQKLDVRRAP